MIIQVEGKEYLLVVSAEDSIRIESNGKEIPLIFAPAHLSVPELTTYIKQFARQGTKKIQPDNTLDFFTIPLFGKTYAVRPVKSGQSKPYLKNDIIYYSPSTFNFRSQEKLESQLGQIIFEQMIMNLIGKWEELFQVLVDDIHFKKLARSPYIIKDHSLTYNNSNIQLDIRVNDYLLAKALIEVKGKNTFSSNILENYFPEIRQIEKILSYGS